MPRRNDIPVVVRSAFDASNPNWSKYLEYNLAFLNNTEHRFDRKLKTQGHLFLNEVLNILGIPQTPEGASMGWYIDPREDPWKQHVDFGIDDSDFALGTISLRFNVDGDLLKVL